MSYTIAQAVLRTYELLLPFGRRTFSRKQFRRIMDAGTLGRVLMYLGLGLVLLGGLVVLLGRVIDLGNLPGDFLYESDTVRIYVPIATMLVLSVVLTLLVNLALRLFR